MFYWTNPSECFSSEFTPKNIATINLAHISKHKNKFFEEKDKSSQMKQFVAVMMAKKGNKKSVDNFDLESKLSYRRNSGLLKHRALETYQ